VLLFAEFRCSPLVNQIPVPVPGVPGVCTVPYEETVKISCDKIITCIF
jgi:hypothetical protein